MTKLSQAEIVRRNLSNMLGYEVQMTDEPDWVVQQRNRDLTKPVNQVEFDSIMNSIANVPTLTKDMSDCFEDGWYATVEAAKASTPDAVLVAILDSAHSEMQCNCFRGADFNDGYESAKCTIEYNLKQMLVPSQGKRPAP